MRRRRWAVWLSVLVLAGCGRSREVTVGEKDNGRKISLRQGQVLVIRLTATPTSGYMWETAGIDSAVLRQMGEVELEAKSDKIGAPIEQSFRFEAAAPGRTPVQLAHRRSWEKDKPPLATFSLDVTVR